MNEQSDVNGSMNGGVGTTMNGSTNPTGIKKDPADLIIGSWNDEDAVTCLKLLHMLCR